MSRKHRNVVEGNLLILSDPHLFHGNILLYDGRTQFMTAPDLELYQEYLDNGRQLPKRHVSYQSVETMNQAVLDNVNAAVPDPDRDTVLIVGDFVFGGRDNYRKNAQYARSRIHCRDVRIVFGNHDEPDDLHDLFTHCHDHVTLSAGGRRLFFCHYPMAAWDGSHRGIALCYGHVHGLYERKDHPHPIARPELWAAVDVGVMNNDYKPFTVAQILDRVRPVWENQERASRQGSEHHLY